MKRSFYLFTLFLTSALTTCHSQQQTVPLVVFVTGDHEYSSEGTMPLLARELERNYNLRTLVLKSAPDHNAEENIPGLEALDKADLAIFFLRWRRLPEEQIKHIERYINSGRPVIGFRTSTHAFNYPPGHPLQKWNAFGEFALGSPPGWGGKAGHTHCGHACSTDVTVIDSTASHAILRGVDRSFHARSWLYQVLPLYPAKGSTWLLMGKAVNPEKPDFADNPVAWTWRNDKGGKVFTTTLGHPDDFKVEAFQRLVVNAVHWALDLPVPRWKGRIAIDVAYHGLK
jgi:type 1 glutamine amidotransferase